MVYFFRILNKSQSHFLVGGKQIVSAAVSPLDTGRSNKTRRHTSSLPPLYLKQPPHLVLRTSEQDCFFLLLLFPKYGSLSFDPSSSSSQFYTFLSCGRTTIPFPLLLPPVGLIPPQNSSRSEIRQRSQGKKMNSHLYTCWQFFLEKI